MILGWHGENPMVFHMKNGASHGEHTASHGEATDPRRNETTPQWRHLATLFLPPLEPSSETLLGNKKAHSS